MFAGILVGTGRMVILCQQQPRIGPPVPAARPGRHCSVNRPGSRCSLARRACSRIRLPTTLVKMTLISRPAISTPAATGTMVPSPSGLLRTSPLRYSTSPRVRSRKPIRSFPPAAGHGSPVRRTLRQRCFLHRCPPAARRSTPRCGHGDSTPAPTRSNVTPLTMSNSLHSATARPFG